MCVCVCVCVAAVVVFTEFFITELSISAIFSRRWPFDFSWPFNSSRVWNCVCVCWARVDWSDRWGHVAADWPINRRIQASSKSASFFFVSFGLLAATAAPAAINDLLLLLLLHQSISGNVVPSRPSNNRRLWHRFFCR